MNHFTTLAQKAANADRTTKLLFRKWANSAPKDLDLVTRNLHDLVFSRTDCLSCANCCRTLGPRLTDKDIARLAKVLRLKPSAFTEKYLKLDEDGDYIFRGMPCPFIMEDNRCRVYEERPKACREYPHTDQRKFHQVLDITRKNAFICPAVYEIIEGLKTHYQ